MRADCPDMPGNQDMAQFVGQGKLSSCRRIAGVDNDLRSIKGSGLDGDSIGIERNGNEFDRRETGRQRFQIVARREIFILKDESGERKFR